MCVSFRQCLSVCLHVCHSLSLWLHLLVNMNLYRKNEIWNCYLASKHEIKKKQNTITKICNKSYLTALMFFSLLLFFPLSLSVWIYLFLSIPPFFSLFLSLSIYPTLTCLSPKNHDPPLHSRACLTDRRSSSCFDPPRPLVTSCSCCYCTWESEQD